MCNVSREAKILRKNQKEMLEIKNAVNKMKNTFDKLISRLNMTKGSLNSRICEQKPPKLKSKENKAWKKQKRISKGCGTATKGVTYA